MLFRLWYHACQLVPLILLTMVAGHFFAGDLWSARIANGGVFLLVALGLVGAALGVKLGIGGITTACPKCGKPAEWVSPAKHYLATDCEECRLIGGRPLLDPWPRFLHEFYEDVMDDELAEEEFNAWKE